MLELEKFPIFTQNTHYLESEGQKWLSRYSDVQRHPSRYHRPPLSRETDCEPSFLDQCSSPIRTPPSECEIELDIPMAHSEYERKAIRALKEAGYGNVLVEHLERLRTCEFQEELTVMARVRAYFQVAYKVSTDTPSTAIYVALILESFANVTKNSESLTISPWRSSTSSIRRLWTNFKSVFSKFC
jgi:vacuolar protein sorting-associated protein 1